MLIGESVAFLLQLGHGGAELIAAFWVLVELLLIERQRHFGIFGCLRFDYLAVWYDVSVLTRVAVENENVSRIFNCWYADISTRMQRSVGCLKQHRYQ